jgi:hypothetical protein
MPDGLKLGKFIRSTLSSFLNHVFRLSTAYSLALSLVAFWAGKNTSLCERMLWIRLWIKYCHVLLGNSRKESGILY